MRLCFGFINELIRDGVEVTDLDRARLLEMGKGARVIVRRQQVRTTAFQQVWPSAGSRDCTHSGRWHGP